MKEPIPILFLILSIYCGNLFAQKKDSLIFFNEVSLSVNRTNVEDSNTADKFGYGIGIYRVGEKWKTFKLLLGFEYNRTSQFKKYIYDSHFSHWSDVTYRIHNLSIPVGYRINFGKKIKLFVEQTFFADFTVGSNTEGTYHLYAPFTVPAETKRKGGPGLYGANYGFSFGVGMQIPFKQIELVIKPDYKVGLFDLSSGPSHYYNHYFRVSLGIRKRPINFNSAGRSVPLRPN